MDIGQTINYTYYFQNGELYLKAGTLSLYQLGYFAMKWSFQGVGPEILAQDVRKNPRVVLQDQEPREAKPREVPDLKTPQEGFYGHREPKLQVQPRE